MRRGSGGGEDDGGGGARAGQAGPPPGYGPGRVPCTEIGKHRRVKRGEMEGSLEGAAVFEGVGGLRVAASPLNDPLKFGPHAGNR
ncbi:MAG: hypothetical protein AVDCRST_MAG02-3973 [uncultured Rubrobacteraceae bacterium]|uniref:Uncharacterized protein n=1 Tax=uncultured Rubrobacteraceae bacterium TaxID=349277 RepID=A0A6J4RBT6_9ACTN|nr:MAG: hypothetical protein AVDCRST_MAG02-3973 [uncultured Rubrobacteraceae bacterium]